jgi:hypothetical protein
MILGSMLARALPRGEWRWERRTCERTGLRRASGVGAVKAEA